MLTLEVADRGELAWCQAQVEAHHYLHAPVDVRCRILAYVVWWRGDRIGCLMFGRPEATRCYVGALTYGSQDDVSSGRTAHDRWEVLNLARVWLSPWVKPGGVWYGPSSGLPGYADRRGVWRSTLASSLIHEALARIGYDYLSLHPPVDCAYPYQLQAVLSYCDTRRHRGTIYRASRFQLARTNERAIQTWYTPEVARLTKEQDARVRQLAEQSQRSQRIRQQRAGIAAQQTGMDL